jgi:hypothetical protein
MTRSSENGCRLSCIKCKMNIFLDRLFLGLSLVMYQMQNEYFFGSIVSLEGPGQSAHSLKSPAFQTLD